MLKFVLLLHDYNNGQSAKYTMNQLILIGGTFYEQYSISDFGQINSLVKFKGINENTDPKWKEFSGREYLI